MEITILSMDASSIRLESDPPFITVDRPNIPLAIVLRIAGRSAEHYVIFEFFQIAL